jgi:hypothetical protein
MTDRITRYRDRSTPKSLRWQDAAGAQIPES